MISLMRSLWAHSLFCFALLIVIFGSWAISSQVSTEEISHESYYYPNILPSWLPRTSTMFQERYSCSNAEDFIRHIQYNDDFFHWVLSARHTTWTPGWEVATSNSLKSYERHGKHYTRVFDQLNWSRTQNLLPQLIDIDRICHKGMEEVAVGYFHNGVNNTNAVLPEKPDLNIPDETWTALWTTCHKQLNAQARLSSSCIDIPAVVVANPDPPQKVNNPCHLEFRMVDGAHRLCLRKYLMSLLQAELHDYQIQFATNDEVSNSSKNEIQSKREKLQLTMKRLRQGSFFVLDQTTFESMLTDSDPHISWAKNEDTLMKDISDEVKVDWVQWMKRVMIHVQSQYI